MLLGEEPIDDDEFLYRRINLQYVVDGRIDLEAFRPRREDVDGLSLTRAKYKSPEEAAKPPVTRPGRTYYISSIRASDLKQLNLTIEPKPIDGNLGHCVVPEMNALNRGTNSCRELALRLASEIGTQEILGPFGPFE